MAASKAYGCTDQVASQELHLLVMSHTAATRASLQLHRPGDFEIAAPQVVSCTTAIIPASLQLHGLGRLKEVPDALLGCTWQHSVAEVHDVAHALAVCLLDGVLHALLDELLAAKQHSGVHVALDKGDRLEGVGSVN